MGKGSSLQGARGGGKAEDNECNQGKLPDGGSVRITS